ncbi:putative microtubule-associated protein [Cyclospora cayetanensis]|nr:putative microtubule-associated protein [Cyclospora cayetanensis]
MDATGASGPCGVLPCAARGCAGASASSVRAISDILFGLDSLDGHAVSSGMDGCLCLWSLEGRLVSQWRCDAVPLGLALSPTEGQVVAAAHEDCRVRLWDVRSPAGLEMEGQEAGKGGPPP